jgi:acetyl-CoA carboxylase carboxyl transferase subunit alpha
MADKNIHPWERVQLARNLKRPTSLHLIQSLFPDFLELHGDRLYRDDASFVCGLATLEDTPITIIAQEKGTQTQEKIARNFGMPHPEGYHKALRFAEQAEKFGRPILFVIDTPGAYPGLGAEERGQANAIAASLARLMNLQVPTIAVVLSEGGSGGALAIGVADRIWMFENAVFSILSPEGFASILYKDASLAKQAAAVMKLTAEDLLSYGIIDQIIPEPGAGLHEDYRESYRCLKDALIKEFAALQRMSLKRRLEQRYAKYRAIGLAAAEIDVLLESEEPKHASDEEPAEHQGDRPLRP